MSSIVVTLTYADTDAHGLLHKAAITGGSNPALKGMYGRGPSAAHALVDLALHLRHEHPWSTSPDMPLWEVDPADPTGYRVPQRDYTQAVTR